MCDELLTIKDCFEFGRRALRSVEPDSADFECRQLLAAALGITTSDVILSGDRQPTPSEITRFRQFIADRTAGAPLQYLIGEWDFYNLSFKVGQGVLIPRPETELLVDRALQFLNDNAFDSKNHAEVIDLCAGSGCIGITVACNYNNCDVTSVEKSSDAYTYLLQNIELNHSTRVTPILGDICGGPEGLGLQGKMYDLILSNPPYIKTSEIETLSREVQSEPSMALDGGEDGFDFYKLIVDKWLKALKKGGMILVECGEEQGEIIEKMFSIYCGETFKICDFSGTYRIIGAKFA